MCKKSNITESNRKIKYRLYVEEIVRIGERRMSFLMYNAKGQE
jgi:hypothetical protein